MISIIILFRNFFSCNINEYKRELTQGIHCLDTVMYSIIRNINSTTLYLEEKENYYNNGDITFTDCEIVEEKSETKYSIMDDCTIMYEIDKTNPFNADELSKYKQMVIYMIDLYYIII